MSSSTEKKSEKPIAPTTMEQIIANGKKDGFYVVFVHSERWEKTSEYIGPFDLETATFYTKRYRHSVKNGCTLFKLEGGSTFSKMINNEEQQKEGNSNECYFVTIEDQKDIAYGPFGTLKECYAYLLTKDDKIVNKSKIKQAYFYLGNYAIHIGDADWLDEKKIKDKEKEVAKITKETEERIALENSQKEKQTKKKRKTTKK
jgi:hypothetical protein